MRPLRGVTLAMLIAGVVQFGMAAPANAQSVIEEIVVTAQKREENITDVPLAVSVLGQQQIEGSFSNNMEDIQALVPSVSFRTGNTTRNSALTIRGIGTISFSVAAEPSVSTVVDNVVLGRSGQAFGDLYDLERVEVLRGPQGTLFGKNASAGVVNITTRRPGEELEGYVSGTFYQDNEYQFRARVSGPLTDDLRGSVTVLSSEFDGYITNVFNEETINGYDKQGIRAMLEYDVSDETEVLFIFEDYEADNNCCVDLEARPSGRNPASDAAPSGTGLDLDQRLADHDFETRTLDASTAMSVQIETAWGDHTLTSITAQRTWDNTEFREGDFTSIAGDSDQPVFGVPFQLHDVGPQEWRQFSQELRIASPTGEAFEYQVGLFYWNIDSERNFTRDASCQNNNGQLDLAIANHLNQTLGLPNTPTDVANYIAANNITCNANDIVAATGYMKTEFDNFAVFGQGSYDISETFRLLFGLRYTNDEVSFSQNRRNLDVFGRRGVGVRPRFSENGSNQTDTDLFGSTDESNVSGKIGLQWDVNDLVMAYATYSTGYKGPAYNVFYNMDDDDVEPIKEETSSNIELGLKYAPSWGLFSLAVYNTQIDDFQANNFDPSSGTTETGFTTGGDVETQGVELDFIWAASDQLTFSGGFAFSDSYAKISGEPALPFAPDTKITFAGLYEMPLSNGASIRINGNYVFTDEKLSGNIGTEGILNPEVLLPDYSILNGSIGYHSEDDRLSVSLIGKNLTDESYATTYSGDGFRYQIPRDASRYFGLNFRVNY
ncbi:MAG: TonB-dependent receptor [Gammaproteobacteria bacterium]|nr:TonB-dependent receptor [Gammaproteobacteria bacterium]